MKKGDRTSLLAFLIFFSLTFLIRAEAQKEGAAYFSIGDSLYQLKEYAPAKENFKQAKSYFDANQNWGKAIESLSLIINATLRNRDYEQVLSYESEVLSLSQKEGIGESEYLAKCYQLLAVAKNGLGFYGDALAAYVKAINIYESINLKGNDLAYAYRNAAHIAEMRLDYNGAARFLKKGLTIDDSYYHASLYAQLANVSYFLGDFEALYKYILLGFEANPRASTKAILDINFSDYYLHYKKDYVNAGKYAEAALDYYETIDRKWADRMSLYKMLAIINDAQGLDKQVIHWYGKAEKEASLNNYKGRAKADIFASIGNYYLEKKSLDQALNYFQKALIQVFPDFNESDVLKNPSIDEVYKESWIMDAAAGKAKALKHKFEMDGNIKSLEVAAECYQLVIAEVDQLNKSYGAEASKLYLGEYGYNYFEDAIDIQYLLYELTKDQKALNEIHALMQRSKAIVLSEAIQKNKAIIEAAIPDSLLKIEKELRISIAEKNIELIEYKQNRVKGDDGGDLIEVELSDLASEYEKHLSALKQKFPKFQSLTENLDLSAFQEIQSYIEGKSTMVVEYFAGDESTYALMITANEVEIHKIKNNSSAKTLISDYLSFFENANQFLNDPDAYFKTAYDLYLTLFPGFENSNESFEKIIIIPDGELKRIPFEALVDVADAKVSNNFNHYLLSKYTIYYANSVNMILDEQKNNVGGDFLNVAPGFLERERGLIPLTHSHEELGQLKGIKSLIAGEAKIDRFVAMAEEAKIIHLSTHAKAGSSGEIPKIELIDSTLFLPEIYALNLKADLVVLSACESQSGELKKGEGVMSLGRGFFYAGASSLIASLWSVNEKSTAEIFANFYKGLQSGVPKAEALRQSKLNYLKNINSDLKSAPYYWAGFVYLGANEVIEIPTQSVFSKTGFWILLGGLLFGLVYFFRRF